jgi:hypothetical protein
MTIVGEYKRKQDMPNYKEERERKKREQAKKRYTERAEVREKMRETSKAYYSKLKEAYLKTQNPEE